MKFTGKKCDSLFVYLTVTKIYLLCVILNHYNLTSAKAANTETAWSGPKHCCINGVEQIPPLQDVALQIFSEANELLTEKAFCFYFLS